MNDERKLFVGNLAWAVDGQDQEDIFKEFGTVESAQARRPRATRSAANARAAHLCGAARRADAAIGSSARATANPSRVTQLLEARG